MGGYGRQIHASRDICICKGGRSCGVVVEERRRGAAGRLGLVLGLGSV